jgi:hypothetical protein
MSKTSPINEIIQQLDTLSLEQLLEVREKVNALISEEMGKSIDIDIVERIQAHFGVTLWSNSSGVNIAVGHAGMGKSIDIVDNIHGFELAPLRNLDAEDETLEDVIKLVNEWMSDESGYDEETYPQIESALNQNRVSL